MSLEGIDISTYQGLPDWHQIKLAGKQFGICKATEGLGYEDPTFAHNWAGMRTFGLIRGSYHFLHPGEDGAHQADYHHGAVRQSGRFVPGDFCMIDCEVKDTSSARQVVQCAEAFAARILATTHCGCFFYTYGDFWNSQLGAPESTVLGRCPLVLASYGSSFPTLSNWPSGPAIWQYSESGHVPGIVGNVDLDRFLGTRQQLQTLARQGGRH